MSSYLIHRGRHGLHTEVSGIDSDLEQALRAAYPSGEVESLNESVLVRRDAEKIAQAITDITNDEVVRLEDELGDPRSFKFALTQCDHPEFDDWLWKMTNPQKIEWITRAGEPYPVLRLKLSRVAPCYTFFFNLWSPRGETGYLDANWTFDPPNALWASHLELVRTSLVAHGFKHMTDEHARTKVAFITEKDFDAVPEDDPRWDDDAFEPPSVPASLYVCLFGE